MIKKLHIENFRNIKSLDLTFDEMTSIITGKNNIGKSNTLNALMWFFTDTLLTDKWGSGENDIKSIIPTNHKKGEHTQVTITLDSGAKFSKIFKRSYDSVTGKPNGHNTEYKVNGAKYDNTTSFVSELYKQDQLNFNPKIKNAKDIHELNLMIDPLYALQKLDSKSLRLLLVELGCSVTNEEVFDTNSRFEVLRLDEKKYLGDFTRMRVDLKQKKKLAEDDIRASEVLLESVNDVEEFNDSNLKELEEKASALRIQIKELENGDITNLVKDLNLQKQKVELEKKSYVETEKAKKEAQLKVLDEKINITRANVEKAKNEKILDLNNKITQLNQNKTSLEVRKANYEMVRNNCKKEYTQAINEVGLLENEMANLKAKLVETSERTFNGFVKCPHCGETFAPDQNAFENFNELKTKDIKRIEDRITETEIKIKENKKKQEQLAENGSKSFEEMTAITNEINEVDLKIKDLESQRNSVYVEQVDYSEVDNLYKERLTLKNLAITTIEFDEQIAQIQMSIDKAILDSRKENVEKIQELETELNQVIKPKIEIEYVTKSRWASKLKYQEQLENNTSTLNDIEYKLELVNDFIHTMIAMINQKAKEITGIDFVMLEENLGNDNLKEVCYATVNGVPFGSVNTSQKLEFGIKFIHRIKEILGANQLPILADRMEGFDSINTIKSLTSEQLICTRVGTDDMQNITII